MNASAYPIARVSSHSGGMFLGLQMFFLLAFGIPVVMLSMLADFSLNAESLLGWVIIAYSSLRLAFLAVAGKKQLISLTFWVFVYVWFGVAAMLQLLVGWFPWRGSYSTETIGEAFMVVYLGLLAYELGRLLALRRAAKVKALFIHRQVDVKRTLLYVVFAVITTIICIDYLGGPASLLVSRETFIKHMLEISRGQGKASYMMLAAMLRVPAFIGTVLLLALWINRDKKRIIHSKAVHFLLLLLVSLLNFFVNNPMASARAWIGTIVISLLFIRIAWRRPHSFASWTIGLIFMFIVVFPYADLFRRSLDPSFHQIGGTSASEQLIKNGDYGSFQQVLNGVVYVQKCGLSYGSQILGTLFVWVPRSIWGDKPIDTAELVAVHMGYRYTNLEMPLWAEMYVDGGMVAVAIGLFVFGMLTAICERAYLANQNKDSLTFINLFVPVFAAYQILLIRGDLMSTFSWIFAITVFMLLPTRSAARLP
jgi:oligosaccharide repeat unit polymerase